MVAVQLAAVLEHRVKGGEPRWLIKRLRQELQLLIMKVHRQRCCTQLKQQLTAADRSKAEYKSPLGEILSSLSI